MRSTLFPQELLLAAGGMALLGAASGLRAGASVVVERSLVVPAALAATVILMIPTLYIGAAFAGVAPSAAQMLAGARKALAGLGGVLAGLAPAVAFLVLAGPAGMPTLVASLALLLGALVALRALFHQLFANAQAHRAVPIFGVWSAISVGIGAQMLGRLL
ncbi:MAG: hypothetical protein AB2A00_22475 [Myxococcota bacterium]